MLNFQTSLDLCGALSPRPLVQFDSPSLRYPAWEKEEEIKERRGFTLGRSVFYITVRSRDNEDDIMIFFLKSMRALKSMLVYSIGINANTHFEKEENEEDVKKL